MESLNKQDFYLLKCDFNTNKKVVIRKQKNEISQSKHI